jgi:hypothetical protein
LLSFQIADHLGWQVFDPQVGDFLDKGTANEVLRTQKDFGDTGEEVLRRRAAGEAGFTEIFSEQLACHGAWVLIPTLVIAALAAGYFVAQGVVAESRFPLLFCGSATCIHVLRALACAILAKDSG